MAILPFSAQRIQGQIRQIETQTASFEQDVDAHCSATALIPTVFQAEALHRNVYETFSLVQRQIQFVKDQTGAVLTSPEVQHDYEEALILFTSISDFVERTDRAFKRFTDSLLTKCPVAKIEYGRSLVEAKERSNLNDYESMRKVRGDGNCFVSGLCTLFLETLIKEKRFDAFIETVFNCETGRNFPELQKAVVNTLLNIKECPSQLENVLKDNQKMLPLVAFFRRLAADEMKKYRNDFEDPYRAVLKFEFDIKNIDSRAFDDLVNEYTIGMGHDFSHPSIQALCRRLNFNIFILNVRSQQPLMKILSQGEPKGVLCRNGAHYFVLYPSERAAPREIATTYKVPFGRHALYIRGEIHPDMSWEKGLPLTNFHGDVWQLFSEQPLRDGPYKFLIDNEHWEKGPNHQVVQGKLDGVNPQFDLPPDFYATRVTIKCNVNGNKLFIRGNGAGLNWDKGVELRRMNDDSWVWETGESFENVEFKILLDDKHWENGENRQIECGEKQAFTPKF